MTVCRAMLVLLACAVAGCASDKVASTQPATPEARQAAALHDPFGYGPGKDFGEEQPKDAEGKASFKDDWKRFWNP